MTLSHCWGEHVPYCLTLEIYLELSNGFPVTRLPQTFQDAVETTRVFGKSFLWIDSLCIIQNSAEDWRIESNKMRQTYQNSWLNIAAAGAKDSTKGLYKVRNPRHVVPIFFPATSSRRALSSRYSPNGGSRSHLERRAWVFQEWLLAPRTLIYGEKEVAWECGAMETSESFPHGCDATYGDLSDDDSEESGPRLTGIRHQWRGISGLDSLRRWELWNEIVYQYSMRDLTKFSDKLIAVAGLADDMHSSWPCASYLAGHWSYKLRSGLLWHCTAHPSHHKLQRRSSNPSWSWASVDRHVNTRRHPVLRTDGLAEVLDVHIEATSPNLDFEGISNSYIKIRAPILRTTIWRRSTSLYGWHIEMRSREEMVAGRSDSPLLGIPLSPIPARIEWDDNAWHDPIQAVSVYLVPFEIDLVSIGAEEKLQLQGLLVTPTFGQKGQVRRLGWFNFFEDWHSARDARSHHTWSDLGSDYDSDTASQIDSLSSNDRDLPSELLEEPDQHITALDIAQRLADIRAMVREDGRAHENAEQIIQCMENIIKSVDYRADRDVYCNGPMYEGLSARYGSTAAHLYPKVNSILTSIYDMYGGPNGDARELSQVFEEGHGDGYFTFRLV